MNDVDFIRARVNLEPKKEEYPVLKFFMLSGKNAVWS